MTSELFKMAPEAKYIAVELFER